MYFRDGPEYEERYFILFFTPRLELIHFRQAQETFYPSYCHLERDTRRCTQASAKEYVLRRYFLEPL